MKLMTHNMLTSKGMKNVKEGFPLKIQAEEMRNVDIDYDRDFITRMIPKLDWKALVFAAQCVGHKEDLPDTLPEGYENDNELLKRLHHVLLEVEVVSGCLECPETQRKFPISNGIPNMLLNEDEV
ncbi:multifunctional methyltransferase subunit TRM112-like protein [Portunus trituberculatus]|uniref:multifunctional methyltransferase subunit TRM112-like protein n=1 Tax=Portunus trituberculatus TaxID=210409 RepID=UPI001E1CBF3A|nr:multifunctional methyltransferase subunit TRM112-like protein [Portunus trituberculatus]XP_045108022.1 multifunctional methyltransferase subunit TRM112-like protein [Portunus trituberculatus]XP_045108023.1 multifunctional methyltransferase subunit TRM112-like protein [Portunus trituberculatus]